MRRRRSSSASETLTSNGRTVPANFSDGQLEPPSTRLPSWALFRGINRNLRGDQRAAVVGAHDAESPVERGQPVREAVEAMPVRAHAADAVVADLGLERPVHDADGDRGACGV